MLKKGNLQNATPQKGVAFFLAIFNIAYRLVLLKIVY